MRKRKPLIDCWVGKTIQNTQLCVTIAAGNHWVRDSHVFHCNCSRMSDQLCRTAWVPHVVCILLLLSHFQTFPRPPSPVSSSQREGRETNPSLQIPAYACFWQHFLVWSSKLRKCWEQQSLQGTLFKGLICFHTLVQFIYFSPSWSDQKVKLWSWRDSSVVMSLYCLLFRGPKFGFQHPCPEAHSHF